MWSDIPVLEGMRLAGSGHGGDQAPHSLAVPWGLCGHYGFPSGASGGCIL